MKLVFIGAGNVATHMALQFFQKDCKILQVYSRTIESAKILGDKVDAEITNNLNSIRNDADYYIFSIKDSILGQVVDCMPHQKGVWIHTAGSMSLTIFENKVKDYGVIYPLQTFSKEKEIKWENIPLFIEESSSQIKTTISKLASVLSNRIYHLTTEQRKYVHLSGVYANNFVNQMYELANETIQKANFPFDVLIPLIEETCNKIHSLSPLEAQTGPAVRFDKNVMAKHIELLDTQADKQLYELISESIYKSHKNK